MAVMAKKKPKTEQHRKPNPSGAKLAALRLRLGLTQEEAARKMGVPLNTWRNWEQGRTAINVYAVRLIERDLGKLQ